MVPRSKKPLKRRGSKDRLHVTNYFFQQGQTDKFKLVKNSRACERDGGSQQGGLKWALLLATLFVEKLKEFSHTSVELSRQADCGALRTEFTVLNKTRGL